MEVYAWREIALAGSEARGRGEYAAASLSTRMDRKWFVSEWFDFRDLEPMDIAVELFVPFRSRNPRPKDVIEYLRTDLHREMLTTVRDGLVPLRKLDASKLGCTRAAFIAAIPARDCQCERADFGRR